METTAKSAILFIFLIFVIDCCCGDDRLALLGRLTQDSKVALLPPHQSDVNVNVTASLLQILELNVVQYSMKSTMLFTLDWVDARLSWKMTDYNVSSINLPLSSVWRPDIDIHNSISDNGNELIRGAVRVNNKGEVKWQVRAHLETFCPSNSRKFPFDKHRCEIVIGSAMHDQSALRLVSTSDHTDAGSAGIDPPWVLAYIMVEQKTTRSTCCSDLVSQLVYTLTLERLSSTALLNTVLPTTLLVVISILVFYLPPESGDKVTLNGLLLVCMGLLHQTILHYMPAQAHDVPLLCQYIALVFTVVSVNTIIAVLVTKLCLCANYGKRPPTWVRAFVLKFLAEVVCLQDFNPWRDSREKANPEISVISNGAAVANSSRQKQNTTLHRELRERFAINWRSPRVSEDPDSYVWGDMQYLLADILSCLQDARDTGLREKHILTYRAGIRNEWKKVAMVVDRISAYIIFFGTLALSLYIFFNVYVT